MVVVISVTMRKMYAFRTLCVCVCVYFDMKEKVGKMVDTHSKKVRPDEVEEKQKHTPNVNVFMCTCVHSTVHTQHTSIQLDSGR